MKLKRSSIVSSLLLVYVFLAPLGNLVRFSEEESSYGVATVLLVLVCFTSVPASARQVLRDRSLFATALLAAWMMVASAFAVEPAVAFFTSATLIIYLLAASAAYRYAIDEILLLRLLVFCCLGGTISAGATLVDYVGLFDFPRVNELRASTHTELGYVLQASGAFSRRSSMAVYYSMIITIGLIAPALLPNLSRFLKIYFYSASGTCLVALALTHARGGLLGAIIAASLVLFVSARAPVVAVARVFTFLLATLLIAIVVLTWFPDVWVAYQALLRVGDVASADDFLDESDAMRVVLFKHAFMSIVENPVGHGYSLLSGVPGYEGRLIDPHNIFSQVIWGAGVLGVTWIGYFGSKILRRSWRLVLASRSTVFDVRFALVVMGALGAFLLTGMTHTIISTGVAWIFLGAYLGALRRIERPVEAVARETRTNNPASRLGDESRNRSHDTQ